MLPRLAGPLLLALFAPGCDAPAGDLPPIDDADPQRPLDANATSDVVPAAVLDALDTCMADVVAAPGASGAAVALIADGETVWLQGFGTRHPDRTTPVDPDTRFRVGSVTKVMTATLAMTLVDDGAVELDQPVADVLPPFGDPAHPDYAASLTLRQLLSHQGGLADAFNINGPRDDAALADAVLGDTFANVPYLVQPGTFYNYSNANYSVAGLVAERASGFPFRTAMDARVFGPLQMTRTTFDVGAVGEDGNYAHGVVTGGVFDAEAYDNGWARPAGFAWSSARDLARLVTFLQYGDPGVLAPLAHAELLSPHVDMKVLGELRYGFGLVHSDFVTVEDGFLEYEHIEHNGNLPGYSALVHIAPEVDLGFAFVANGHDVDFHPCIEAALDEFPEFVASVSPPDLQLELTDDAAFLGDYEQSLPTMGDFSIVRGELGGLRISFPALDRNGTPYVPQLLPASRDNFYLVVDGAAMLMTGIFNEAGDLDYLRTRHFVARPLDRALRAQE